VYERFTDRARNVMQFANQEAGRLCHEYIGTEHILLGLVKEGSGVAANVLKNLDVDLRKIRLEVEKLVQSGPEMVTMGKLPQTPRAKKVIEYSMEEARNLNHNYVGTEHILLGLLREQEGVAAQVLMNLGLKLEEVREEVLRILSCVTHSVTQEPRPSDPLVLAVRSVIVAREESDFDRACDAAYRMALDFFEIDESGNTAKVPGWRRATDSIVVVFVSYRVSGGMGGRQHIYTFEARAERNQE
jgi:ATP-dependent Clp protease ATP-binding subunit ClpA